MSYRPSPLFSYKLEPEQLARYTLNELQRVGTAFDAPRKYIVLDSQHKAPDKPFDGMIVKADGTDWNPGAGQGVYAYYGGVWNKL